MPVVAVTATTEILRGRTRIRVNEAYTSALAAAGLIPLVLAPLTPDLAVAALAHVDGLVLTGGEDVDASRYAAASHPANGAANAARDATELALSRAAFEQRLPTLAICRGAQVINVAFGGTLVQDIASECPGALPHDRSAERTARVHDVGIEPSSRLAATLGADQIRANTSHHQSVARVADPFRVTARAPDGIIEGIEAKDPAWWMLAVQWHPEELTETREDWDRRLFADFARAVGAQTVQAATALNLR